MKKVISALLVVLLILSSTLFGCTTKREIKAEPSKDKYRNFYEIFINSFCDSNNDETGDFQGIISKLDYLNDGDINTDEDLGIDGIWLTPMMPSKSYHKYDVENYFDIDPEFGTLDDFDIFIKECDKRGIKVIIDLVLNHSSSRHPYFEKACEEVRNNKLDGYAKYYHFSKTSDTTFNQKVPNSDYYYEGEFSPDMPDWNLSYEGTRDYFTEIAKFWLDRGVAGFRLDAVKYFTDDVTDGTEFLKWFYDTCKSYKEDVYMVGEDWDDPEQVYESYESGIDSLFNFRMAGSEGQYVNTARSGMVKDLVGKLKKYNTNILKHNKNAINANFLTNHDMPRAGSMLDVDENKFAACLYILSPGNSFTYYGEEIGMEGADVSGDASYRTPMIWDNDNLPDIFVDGISEVEKNELGGVKQQQEDENSLLNTYKKLYRIKLQNPEIARGSIEKTLTFDDNYSGGFVEKYKDSQIAIVFNGNKEKKEYDIKDAGSNLELRANVVVTLLDQKKSNEEVKLSGTKLIMPAYSCAVVKIK